MNISSSNIWIQLVLQPWEHKYVINIFTAWLWWTTKGDQQQWLQGFLQAENLHVQNSCIILIVLSNQGCIEYDTQMVGALGPRVHWVWYTNAWCPWSKGALSMVHKCLVPLVQGCIEYGTQMVGALGPSLYMRYYCNIKHMNDVIIVKKVGLLGNQNQLWSFAHLEFLLGIREMYFLLELFSQPSAVLGLGGLNYRQNYKQPASLPHVPRCWCDGNRRA